MKKKPETMTKNELLEQHMKAHPFLEETGHLFLSLQAVLADTVTPVELPEADECRALVKDGVPLLQHPVLHKTIVKVAAAVLPDVLEASDRIEAPAQMQKALDDWRIWVGETSLREVQEFFSQLIEQKDEEIHHLAEMARLHESLLRLIGWGIIDALIPAEVKAASFWEGAWKRNYCPVCGRQPVMAQLRKESEANGAERYLSCGGCHTQWHFTRIGCVYCGCKDTEKLPLLVPDEGSVRLDTCDECHSYIKTYVGHGQEDIYLQDWTTLHLDVLGEEKGLSKKGNVLLANG